MDLAHIDNEKKDYYYYPNQNTKIEVIFRTREDGKMEKVTRTYHLAEYSETVAQKIKERQSWSKFGQAANNPNNKSITSFGDDVEFEFLINYQKKQSSEEIDKSKSLKEINKIFYIESYYNVKIPEISEIQKQMQNKMEYGDNIIELKPKKSLVNCRHCGDSSHWSIKCPLQKNRLDEIEKQNQEKYDSQKKQKQEEYEKQKQEKFNERKKDQSSLVGLKVSDLDESSSEGELKNYFHQFGNIINFFMIRNKKNHKFNGTVYVTYATQQENDDAMNNIKRRALNYIIPSVELAKQKEYY
jgi:hypothetical protein